MLGGQTFQTPRGAGPGSSHLRAHRDRSLPRVVKRPVPVASHLVLTSALHSSLTSSRPLPRPGPQFPHLYDEESRPDAS